MEKQASHRLGLERFHSEAQNSLSMQRFDIEENPCPNKYYNILEDILKQCYEKAFVTRAVGFNKKKHLSENLMIFAILKSINNKNKLYKNLMISTNE